MMRKTSQDEQILRATKEIVVKFIETGRISPTGFPEAFKAIYRAVDETVKVSAATETADENAEEAS
jgi:predicted transcriptional regulator